MDKLEKIKDAAWKYLSVVDNYPKDQCECRYISGSGLLKQDHPSKLKSWVVDEVFSKQCYLKSYNLTDGWARIAYAQKAALYNFIFDNLVITESELDNLLFDHGLKLTINNKCGPKNTWLRLSRFKKVIDEYAICLKSEKKDRVIDKVKILINHTGYKMEDIIKIDN
jgi:hypothetical protein